MMTKDEAIEHIHAGAAILHTELKQVTEQHNFLLDLIRAKAKEQSGNAAHFANHLLTELKTRYGVE
jgi:hypothetical protein